MKKEGKCTCSMPVMIGIVILLTAAAFLLVWGFTTQFQSGGLDNLTTILPAYFVGFLLVLFAKKTIIETGAACPVHGMRKM